jgi:hypothetical protein
MKSIKICTSNREIYVKFNNLNISDEIILRNVKPFQIERIIENANKNGERVFEIEKYDTHIIVKKIANINITAHLKNPKYL